MQGIYTTFGVIGFLFTVGVVFLIVLSLAIIAMTVRNAISDKKERQRSKNSDQFRPWLPSDE